MTYRVDSLKLDGDFSNQMNFEAFLEKMDSTGWKIKFIFPRDNKGIYIVSERKKWWEKLFNLSF